jgi:Contractile injection system tube protein
MDVLKLFKTEKLTIGSITDPSKKFETMFNPSQYTITRQVKWNTQGTLTANGSATSTTPPPVGRDEMLNQRRFEGLEYGSFAVRLILDGTGATDFGWTTGFGLDVPKVKDKVQKFMDVCYHIVESKHEPNRVSIKWGGLAFNAVLERVAINYTLFDNAGNALRAELDTSFIITEEEVKLSSPDLTHTREVHEGDTLPLLSKEIYGSSRHYLFIAEANKLDDFRHLKPGTKLYFPPLENQT